MAPRNKTIGFIGFAILVLVLIYLVLKIAGVVHSAEFEEILLATVLGQIFYNSYVYRAVHDLEERLKRIEQNLNKKE